MILKKIEFMKILRFLFFVSLTVLFLSCGDDDDDSKFTPESLKQTQWEGPLVVKNGNAIIRELNVEMLFYSTNDGQYIYREQGKIPFVYDFRYSIDGKIMNIEDGPLGGKLFMTEFSEKKMVLEATGSYKLTLTLNRKY